MPEARIAIGHGQMAEDELEEAMLRFVRREADILVATTIIESGLDIPNANTIFINQADNYGLADLHQLRGRVGRYKHRAYAYLLLDSDRHDDAERGAAAQGHRGVHRAGGRLQDRHARPGDPRRRQHPGHAAERPHRRGRLRAVLPAAGKRGAHAEEAAAADAAGGHVDLPWPAYLPRDYVPGQKLRIEVYRRLARVRRLDRLEDFRQELRDRFGPLPEPAEWLLRLAELRLLAVALENRVDPSGEIRRGRQRCRRMWCSATAIRAAFRSWPLAATAGCASWTMPARTSGRRARNWSRWRYMRL